MKSNLVESWDEFYRLEGEWNTLLSSSASDSIFLTWEWVAAWVEIHKSKHKPFIVVTRDDNGSLIGLAPFYLSKMTVFKYINLQCLRILGDADTGAEYPDFIVQKTVADVALYELIDILFLHHRQWDLVWMPNMSGWAGNARQIRAVCLQKKIGHQQRENTFSSFSLIGDLQTFLSAFSRKHREQIRRQSKKILSGSVVERGQTCEEVAEYLDSLFSLHNKRRRQLHEQGIFEKRPDMKAFYQRFVPVAMNKGWLSIFRLNEQGQTRAVQLGYVYNNIFHQMQEGFDPDFAAGAGNTLRLEVINNCFKDKINEYDFLGGFTEHKRRWQARERAGYDILIAGHNWIAKLIIKLGIWPTGRFMKVK